MDNKQQDAICVAISTKLKERAKEFAKNKGLKIVTNGSMVNQLIACM